MTDQLIEQIREDDAKGLILDPLEARILADAKIIKAADDLADLMDIPDQACGETSTYHYEWDKVDAALAAYRAVVSERDT